MTKPPPQEVFLGEHRRLEGAQGTPQQKIRALPGRFLGHYCSLAACFSFPCRPSNKWPNKLYFCNQENKKRLRYFPTYLFKEAKERNPNDARTSRSIVERERENKSPPKRRQRMTQ
ncbi:hypothetical protein B0H19DRAFT_1071031 [Mycena capillaripes]|nr:hypothetical protein B0H19DRAFT_1071031 [Mycena capillaripes]